MRTRTILRMIYHAPAVAILSFLGYHGDPKPPRKDYSAILLFVAVIVLFGLAFNYMMNPN
jgi:hypothetical protein